MPGAADQPAAPRVRWLLALAVVLADQVTKALAVARLKPAGCVPVIPGWFNLCYVENRGAAWGMLAGRQALLIAFSAVTLAFLIRKRREMFGAIPCGGLILAALSGGILGNLIDRARLGHVTDFLDFHWRRSHFPAFNIADAAICCSAFALVILHAHCERKAKKGAADEGSRNDDTA